MKEKQNVHLVIMVHAILKQNVLLFDK